MRQSRLVLVSSVVAAASAAASATPLAAQSPGSFDLFAQRMESSSSPLFAGLSLARFSGPLGVRLSGSLNFSRDAGRQDVRYVTQTRCHRGNCERVAIP